MLATSGAIIASPGDGADFWTSGKPFTPVGMLGTLPALACSLNVTVWDASVEQAATTSRSEDLAKGRRTKLLPTCIAQVPCVTHAASLLTKAGARPEWGTCCSTGQRQVLAARLQGRHEGGGLTGFQGRGVDRSLLHLFGRASWGGLMGWGTNVQSI